MTGLMQRAGFIAFKKVAACTSEYLSPFQRLQPLL
jgi:hypothetical protein